MKKEFIFLVMFLLLAIPVAAVNPKTENYVLVTGEGELFIVYPQSLVFPKGEAVNISFDVVDYYGFKADNTTINCTFTSVNNKGQVVANGNAPYFDSDFRYWQYPLTASQNSKTGTYGFYIHCANSTEAGFVSYIYVINENGENEEPIDVGTMLYFLFIIAMFIIIGVVNTHPYFKWGSFVFAFYESIVMLGFVYATYQALDTQWLFNFNFYFTLLIGFMILILSFMFRSINLMTHDTETDKSQLGMSRFSGDKFK